jgi:hypothetical protein
MAFTYRVNVSEDTPQDGRQFIQSLVETIEESDLCIPTTAECSDIYIVASETPQPFRTSGEMFSIAWYNWRAGTIENHFDIACYPYGEVILYPNESNTLFGMHQAEIMRLYEDA